MKKMSCDSYVDSDVPSLSSLILRLNESAFNLRDEQTRETSLRNGIVALGVENYIYSAEVSHMSWAREAELMQSITLPAMCKRTRARLKVLVASERRIRWRRHDSRALSRGRTNARSRAFAASTRLVCV